MGCPTALIKASAGAWAVMVLLRGSAAMGQELPLEEAVQLALKHNVDIANTALDVSKTKDRTAAFHTQLFPKFSVYMLGSEQLQAVNITVAKGTLGTDYRPAPRDRR